MNNSPVEDLGFPFGRVVSDESIHQQEKRKRQRAVSSVEVVLRGCNPDADVSDNERMRFLNRREVDRQGEALLVK